MSSSPVPEGPRRSTRVRKPIKWKEFEEPPSLSPVRVKVDTVILDDDVTPCSPSEEEVVFDVPKLPETDQSQDHSQPQQPGNNHDELYWHDKIDTLNHCTICLCKVTGSRCNGNGRVDFKSMNHLWQYLEKPSLVFCDYVFLAQEKGGVFVESKIPPLCRSCLDSVKVLNSLHDELGQIKSKIFVRVKAIQKSLAAGNFQKKESLLETEMRGRSMPFRCMSNTIQFLSQLHRPYRDGSTGQADVRGKPEAMDGSFDGAEEDEDVCVSDVNAIKEEPAEDEDNLDEDDEDNDYEAQDDVEDADYEPLEHQEEDTTPRRRSKRQLTQAKTRTEDKDNSSPPKKIRRRDSNKACPVCKKKFLRYEKLKIHWWRVHKSTAEDKKSDPAETEGAQTCSKCKKKYKYSYTFQFHQEHEQDRCASLAKPVTIKCLLCDEGLTSRKALARHRRRVHHLTTSELTEERSKFPCKTCDKSFKFVGHLERHMLEHSKPPPSRPVCEFCGKSFLTLKYLKEHRVTHSSERPFICDYCSKSFKKNSTLQGHIKETHFELIGGTRPVCTLCGKSFGNPKYLRDHMTLHTGRKVINCDVCGRKFRKNSNLLSHKRRMHSSKKVQPTHNTRGKIRPTCTICQRTFCDSRTLQKHFQNRHSEEPLSTCTCDICGDKFPSKYELRYHKNENHIEKERLIGHEMITEQENEETGQRQSLEEAIVTQDISAQVEKATSVIVMDMESGTHEIEIVTS